MVHKLRSLADCVCWVFRALMQPAVIVLVITGAFAWEEAGGTKFNRKCLRLHESCCREQKLLNAVANHGAVLVIQQHYTDD